MAAATPSIFHGVVYHIDPLCEARDLIRLLLKHNGGKEKSQYPTLHPTRIIVDPQHFASAEPSKFSAYNRPRPIVVARRVRVPSDGTAGSGYQVPTLADGVTHLVLDHTPGQCDLGDFRPICLSVHWVLDCLAKKALLPSAPYEFNPDSGKEIISTAQRFCEVLSFAHKKEQLIQKSSIRSLAIPFLPFEILSKIFVEIRDDALHNIFSSLTSIMLEISHVCRHWRAVAHSTGELWTHLRLNFHCKQHYHRLRNLVEQWLARSHPRALSFSIRSCYPGSGNPIIDVLLTHASRICELSLQLPAAHFIPFLQAPAGSFPLLQNLSMSIVSISDCTYDPDSGRSRYEYFEEYDFGDSAPEEGVLWETMNAPVTSLQNASQLQSIKISTFSFFSLDPKFFPLAWGNLTELDFESVPLSVRDAVYLLPQCTRLQYLKFATEDTPNLTIPPLPPLPRVRLSQLTGAHWSRFSDDGISVSDQLILPRLTTLSLYRGSWESFLRLYANSSFALRELSLSHLLTTFPLFTAFLRQMQSLVSLKLSPSLWTTDQFLAFFKYEKQRNPILPNLESLEIYQNFSESAYGGITLANDTVCAMSHIQ
ncbi:hypothetical protein C8R45DRAFT_1153770 [Mycena sanguinolenta]|nr:hypothetical protein C8R45DRAFT_1153770 [Mycena sanguinolenta]